MSLANIFSQLQNKFIVRDLDASVLEINDTPINPSGGSVGSLAAVLATGNTSGANNMELEQYLTLDNKNDNILAQLHFDDNNGSWQMSNTTGALEVQYYPQTGTEFNALTFNTDKSVVVGDTSNSSSVLKVTGASGIGNVYDSVYNVPPSGGGSQNLSQVLTNGNDAGGQTLGNVGLITFPKTAAPNDNQFSITVDSSGNFAFQLQNQYYNPPSAPPGSLFYFDAEYGDPYFVSQRLYIGGNSRPYDPLYNPLPNFVNLLSYMANNTQSIATGANQIVQWDTADTANTHGTNYLSYSSGEWTYSSSNTVPLLVTCIFSVVWAAGTAGTVRSSWADRNSLDSDRNGLSIVALSSASWTTTNSTFSMVMQPGDSFTTMCYHNDSATTTLNQGFPSRIQIGMSQMGATSGAGSSPPTSVVGCIGYTGGTQTITNSVTVLTWGSTDSANTYGTTPPISIDSSNSIFTNTNSSPILIDVKGFVIWSNNSNVLANADLAIFIVKNGNQNDRYGLSNFAADSDIPSQIFASTMVLQPNDYFTVSGWISTGSGITGDWLPNRLQITRLL